MKRIVNILLGCTALLISFTANAQNKTVVAGNVKVAKTNETISAVSVTIKNSSQGTFTNDKGEFSFTTTQKPPFTLVFSSVGYASKEVSFTGSDVSVELTTAETLGQEVVVAATRVQERILESPVSIERMGAAAIRNAAAPNYYDGLANFKGVDMTVSSTNFRTVSTRGFNGSGNLRFNQLVDGMDNQAPGLNFSVGSIVGPNQLDVESVELLQGASSALYGSGGMTGTLLMNSKNPFKYQGLSFQIKGGINHIDNKQRSSSAFHNWDIRFAQKINDKWAFKVGAEMTTAQDWQAQDYTNLQRNNVYSTPIGGTRATDQGYDGVNVYGDEVAINMQAKARGIRSDVGGLTIGGIPVGIGILQGVDQAVQFNVPITTVLGQIQANPLLTSDQKTSLSNALPFLFATSSASNNPYKNAYLGTSNGLLSRTGYNEKDLVDYNNYNVKLNGAIHYKITNNIEASISANYGQGTTVYTGSDRYSIKNLKIGQYKAEVKGNNWFLRAYTTQENSGDAFTATTAAVAINRAWKTDSAWFTQYLGAYSQAYFGLNPAIPAGVQGNAQASDAVARGIADNGRYLPGSDEFKNAYNTAITTNISQGGKNVGGAKFNDQTSLYHFEGQYKFNQIKAIDLMVGASYRTFNLSSNGTIFADDNGSIKINEYGGYLQLQKKFLNDKLKISVSGRYDKNSNFDGRFTPRATLTYEVKKNNFIRFSYQQAYRFPTTQDQWINLRTPGAILIGGMPYFKDKYNLNSTNPIQYVYTSASVNDYRNTLIQSGNPNPNVLKTATFNTLKAETSNSFELGFRGLVAKDVLIDFYAYYSQFNDFIGREAVARAAGYDTATSMKTVYNQLLDPSKTDNISFVTNSKDVVKAFGFGLSVEYKFYQNFVLNANVSGDKLDGVSETLFSQYNTPQTRFNIGVSNTNIYKNIGFGAIYRWQDKVKWQGTFGTGDIPSYGTVDAFLSYKADCIKSLIKVGATNLYNKYYRSAFGNPQVGGLYYISFGYNIF